MFYLSRRQFVYVKQGDNFARNYTFARFYSNDVLFWSFGIAITVIEFFFIFSFLPNLNTHDYDKYMFAFALVLIRVLFLGPLFFAVCSYGTFKYFACRNKFAMEDLAHVMDVDLDELKQHKNPDRYKPVFSRLRLDNNVPNAAAVPTGRGEAEERAWQSKVEELVHRGISVANLLNFYEGLGHGYFMHFDAKTSLTHDVVRQAIIQLTRQDHYNVSSKTIKIRISSASLTHYIVGTQFDVDSGTLDKLATAARCAVDVVNPADSPPGSEEYPTRTGYLSCVCMVAGKEETAQATQKTSTASADPLWDYELTIERCVFGETLKFILLQHDNPEDISTSYYVCETRIISSSFYARTFQGKLELKDSQGAHVGELSVRVEPQRDTSADATRGRGAFTSDEVAQLATAETQSGVNFSISPRSEGDRRSPRSDGLVEVQATEEDLYPFAEVLLRGFEGLQGIYNGKKGVLLRFISEEQGWHVQFDDGVEWTVKRENLRIAQAPANVVTNVDIDSFELEPAYQDAHTCRSIRSATVIVGAELEMMVLGYSDPNGAITVDVGQDDGGEEHPTWFVPDDDFIVTFVMRSGGQAGGCQFFTQNGVASPWFGGMEGEQLTFQAREGHHIIGFTTEDDTIVDFDAGVVSAGGVRPTGIEDAPLPDQAQVGADQQLVPALSPPLQSPRSQESPRVADEGIMDGNAASPRTATPREASPREEMELRVAEDGTAYTRTEFLTFFGEQEGQQAWDRARQQDIVDFDTAEPVIVEGIVDFDTHLPSIVDFDTHAPADMGSQPQSSPRTLSDSACNVAADEYGGQQLDAQSASEIQISFGGADDRSSLGSLGSPRIVNAVAYATLVGDGEPEIADKLVTYSWGNIFTDFLAAVLADALCRREYAEISVMLEQRKFDELRVLLKEQKVLDTRYWMCCFAVNHHTTICHQPPDQDSHGKPIKACDCGVEKVSPGIQCEVDKFDEVMAYLKSAVNAKYLSVGAHQRFSQVIACDKMFRMWNRTWCLAEVAEARKAHIQQTLKYHSKQALKDSLDVIGGINIDISESSFAEDKTRILAKIDDKNLFNKRVKKLILKKCTPFLGTRAVSVALRK